jgi:hypothetical protein
LIRDLAKGLGYCLSFDLWTSPSGLQDILLFVHYSSENYVYKEGLVDFIEIGSDHSGETLAQYVFE